MCGYGHGRGRGRGRAYDYDHAYRSDYGYGYVYYYASYAQDVKNRLKVILKMFLFFLFKIMHATLVS